jgi:transposase-like protein
MGMKQKCPNSNCQSEHVHSIGTYYRKGDSRHIKRYKCTVCKRRFSPATGTRTFGQKKRRINNSVFEMLSIGVSQRKIATTLGISRATVVRRLGFWSEICAEDNEILLAEFFDAHPKGIQHVQFDELETFEHTKYKPIAVSVAVDAPTRLILGANTTDMAPKGRAAKPARELYGPRPDARRQGLRELLIQIEPLLEEKVLFSFDKCPFYPPALRKIYGKELELDENQTEPQIVKQLTQKTPNSSPKAKKKRKHPSRKPKDHTKKRKNFRLRPKKLESTPPNSDLDSDISPKITQLAPNSPQTLINGESNSIQELASGAANNAPGMANKETNASISASTSENDFKQTVQSTLEWFYFTYKGARPKRSGMGELKDEYPDPLFFINHTLASIRAGMSRLLRRTWNTTKRQKYLQQHLNVYIYYHNCRILKEIARKEAQIAAEQEAKALELEKEEQARAAALDAEAEAVTEARAKAEAGTEAGAGA